MPEGLVQRTKTINEGVFFMKKLTKSRSDKKICGVCGGLAKYLETDSTVVRLLTLFLMVIGLGTALIVYFGAAVIMPYDDAE